MDAAEQKSLPAWAEEFIKQVSAAHDLFTPIDAPDQLRCSYYCFRNRRGKLRYRLQVWPAWVQIVGGGPHDGDTWHPRREINLLAILEAFDNKESVTALWCAEPPIDEHGDALADCGYVCFRGQVQRRAVELRLMQVPPLGEPPTLNYNPYTLQHEVRSPKDAC